MPPLGLQDQLWCREGEKLVKTSLLNSLWEMVLWDSVFISRCHYEGERDSSLIADGSNWVSDLLANGSPIRSVACQK